MKASQVIEYLQGYLKRHPNDDPDIVIRTHDGSQGYSSSCDVGSIAVSTCWDKGKLFIFPIEKLQRSES